MPATFLSSSPLLDFPLILLHIYLPYCKLSWPLLFGCRHSWPRNHLCSYRHFSHLVFSHLFRSLNLSWSSRCFSLPASPFKSITAVPRRRRRRIRPVLPCLHHHRLILAAEILFIQITNQVGRCYIIIQESSQRRRSIESVSVCTLQIEIEAAQTTN